MSILRDMFNVFWGRVLIQSILLISIPIIATIYSPTSFGHYGIFMAIAGILSVIVTFKYEVAIVVEEDRNKRITLVYSIFFIVIVLSLLFFIVLYLFNFSFLGFNKIEGGGEHFCFFILFYLLAFGLKEVLRYWNIKMGYFAFNSVTDSTVSFISQSLKIFIGLLGYASSIILIGSNIIGQFCGLVLIYFFFKKKTNTIKNHIKYKEVKSVLKKHKAFPMYIILSAFINKLSFNIPVLLFGVFFNPKVVGLFVFSRELLLKPSQILLQTISNVLFKEAAGVKEEHILRERTELFLKFLFSFIIFPMLFVLLFGDIINKVLGDKWISVGLYIRILSIYVIFNIVLSGFSRYFIVFEKQKSYLIYSGLLAFLRIGFICIGALIFKDVEITLILFVCSSIIGLLIMYFNIFSEIGLNFLKILKDTFKIFMFAVCILLIIFLFNFFLKSLIILLFLGVVGELLFVFILIRSFPEYKRLYYSVIEKLRRRKNENFNNRRLS